MITEWHTSDLTARCFRAVQLRHEGKRTPDVTTALYRGSLFHECVAHIHKHADWLVDGKHIARKSLAVVGASLIADGRTMTKAVEKNQDDISVEIGELVDAYTARFAAYFEGCELLGVEVPVRASLGFMDFASHIDLLFRDSDGRLWVWDWKTGESPSWEYLNRGLQLPCYGMAVAHGTVMLGDEWVSLAESPMLAWIEVEALLPYKRATSITDHDSGELFSYAKGDLRPLDKIVRKIGDVDYDALTDQLTQRMAMAEAGLWPAVPDPLGCRVCDSRAWCKTLLKGEER